MTLNEPFIACCFLFLLNKIFCLYYHFCTVSQRDRFSFAKVLGVVLLAGQTHCNYEDLSRHASLLHYTLFGNNGPCSINQSCCFRENIWPFCIGFHSVVCSIVTCQLPYWLIFLNCLIKVVCMPRVVLQSVHEAWHQN